MNPPHSKNALREKILAAVTAIPAEKRKSDSCKICAALKQWTVFKTAKTILFFAPLPNEPDVWPLLAEALGGGKIAALPRFRPADQTYAACRIRQPRTEIVTGQFGIREPAATCMEIPAAELDLILVPGVAFDRRGHRLGRGKGFYDRLLQRADGVKCGVAFAEQMAEAVPAEAHDVRMNFVVTPTRWIKCET